MVHNLQRDDEVGYCARLFADIDRRIESLGVRDAEAPRVAGFPYLRVDRFSAALGPRATGAAQEQAWRARLQQLDEAARATELANAALSIDDLPRCRGLLGAADAAAIRRVARVGSSAGRLQHWHASARSVSAHPLAFRGGYRALARGNPLGVRDADRSAADPGPAAALWPAARRFKTGASSRALDALGVPVFSAAKAGGALSPARTGAGDRRRRRLRPGRCADAGCGGSGRRRCRRARCLHAPRATRCSGA